MMAMFDSIAGEFSEEMEIDRIYSIWQQHIMNVGIAAFLATMVSGGANLIPRMFAVA